MTREEPVSEPKPDGKPFVVSKRLVWEAWRRVKANKGAAGVDEESIQAFEENLRGNLYKVWNRMSSGSYIPPPVRAVEIPKKSGGSRMLGVPTSRIGSLRRSRTCTWSPRWSLFSTRIHTGIGRDGRLMTRCGHAGRGVGNTTGL
jgi:hypothetical protein